MWRRYARSTIVLQTLIQKGRCHTRSYSLCTDLQTRTQTVIQGKQAIFTPTTVQTKAFEPLYSGENAVICAETGSGKTLAYLLPLLQRLFYDDTTRDAYVNQLQNQKNRGSSGKRNLMFDPALVILVPTQELVHQLTHVIQSMWPPKTVTMQNQSSYDQYQEASALENGKAGSMDFVTQRLGDLTVPCYANIGPGKSHDAAVVIGTPRAVMENIPSRRLRAVKSLVFDEADLLLSGDYAKATTDVLDAFLYKHLLVDAPQYVFCGATIPNRGKRSVAAYLDRFIRNALHITTEGTHRRNEKLTTSYIAVDEAENIFTPQVKKKLSTLFTTAINSHAGAQSGAKRVEIEEIMEALSNTGKKKGNRSEDAAEESPVTFDNVSIDEIMESRDNRDIVRQTIFEDTVLPSQEVIQEYYVRQDREQKRLEEVDQLKRQALLEMLLLPTSCAEQLTSQARNNETSIDISLDDVLRKRQGRNPLILSRKESKASEHLTTPNLGRHARRKLYKERRYLEQQRSHVDSSGASINGDKQTLSIPGTLVFCNSARRASDLTTWLQDRLGEDTVAGLHRSLARKKRKTNLDRFMAGNLPILVCTDIASRGIDTSHVSHVIQFDFATNVVSYFHRIGRTGRMHSHGYASHIISRDDASLAAAIRFVEENGYDIEGLFSRRRGLRRRLKKSREMLSEEKETWESLLNELDEGGDLQVNLADADHPSEEIQSADDTQQQRQQYQKQQRHPRQKRLKQKKKGTVRGAYGMELGVMS